MAFGFGFNKQKVLSAAEKYVQQGKMQNAIAEYEKVLKADPKDLTVTNTVGDLYSRLGEASKATECFKAVGDAYANQGFTVKAIAMYKKISKLQPSLESVLKLAELYTQQGLFNDARAQYLQVAEEFLKSGELENGVRIFQKILEMDPENTTMRIRLAEVYIRLGKKNEAWQIFSAAAETLRSKGSLPAAEEVLQRMLTLDPGNGYALLMQGRNLLEAGDAEAAIESLQKVSDLDSNPDGLRDLLKAYLKTGRLSDAGTLASKLLTVHNDLASISAFTDALMQAGQFENALQVYDQHAERLLAENSDKVLKNLHSVIGHVRDNPASLEKLLDLFHKAGDNSHTTEVIELLAHASVQSGDLPRARDLYQKLTTMEPGNPLHMSNYQQVASQISGDSGATLISPEEAVVIVDELEATSPSIHQHYSDAVALAVRSALTDAELFISYNMPAKAMGPLLSALPQAPTDLRLNQRLASLHTRAGRFAEAGVCCRTLQDVYSEAGYPEEATRYGELADRYQERSGVALLTDSVAEDVSTETKEEVSAPAEASAPWPAAPPQATEDAEFAIVSDTEQDQAATQEQAQEEVTQEVQEDQVEEEQVREEDAQEDQVSAVAESADPAEIDLSSEWDDSVVVEADSPAAEAAEAEITDAVGAHELPADEVDEAKAAETVEEIRFYLEHGMPEQASTAFEKLQTVTNNEAILSAMEAEIQAASQPAPAAEEPAAEEEVAAVEAATEITVEEPSEEITIEETPVAIEETPVEEEPAAVVEEAPPAPPVPPAKRAAPPVWHAKPVAPKPVATKPVAPKPPVAAPPAAPPPAALEEFVTDLESSLGDSFLPGTVSHEAEPAVEHASAHAKPELEPIGNAAPTTFGVPQAEPMGEFVADLEASLGEDFLKGAPVEPQPAPQSHAAPRVEAPAASAPAQQRPASAPQVSAPIAASAAAGAVS